MAQNLLSTYIRPHLIPFLYEELQGDTKAAYANKKVKIVRVTKKSPLGQLLHIFKSRATSKDYAEKIEKFNIFISLDENSNEASKVSVTEGYHVKRVHNQNKDLTLLKEDIKCINDMLESIFRISLLQYLKGYIKENTDSNKVKQGIHLFMLEYNLYEYPIDPENLRDFYYYNTKEEKDYLLNRLKTPVSAKSTNYNIP